MTFKELTSKQNHFIKYITALKSKKQRDIEKCCIVEGRKIIEDLAAGGHDFKMFFVGESELAKYPEACEKIAKRTQFNFTITERLKEYLSTTENSAGFFAVSETIVNEFMQDDIKDNGRYILLDGIQDPGNMGTVFRSASAFGIDGVILYGECADPFGPKVIRASSGQTLILPIYSFSFYEEELKSRGFRFIGTSLQAEKNIDDFDFSAPVCVMMGNEARGLSPELCEFADAVVKIPMLSNVDSLNVSVAASIICYQMYLKGR